MSTMSTVTAAAAEWTLAYTASAAVSVVLQSMAASDPIRVRIGATAGTGDALDAAAFLLMPFELRTLPLANGDKLLLAPHRSTSSTDASSVRASMMVP